jgi:hypothetical protein
MVSFHPGRPATRVIVANADAMGLHHARTGEHFRLPLRVYADVRFLVAILQGNLAPTLIRLAVPLRRRALEASI